MKKKIFNGFIFTICALMLTLTACSSVVPPAKTVRWSNETFTYEVSMDTGYTRETVKGAVLLPLRIEEGGIYTSEISYTNDGSRANEVRTVMDMFETYLVEELRGDKSVEEFKAYVAEVIKDVSFYRFEDSGNEKDSYLCLRTQIESECKFALDANPTFSRRTVKGGVVIIDSHSETDDKFIMESCHIEFNDYVAEATAIMDKKCNYTVRFEEQANPKYDDISGVINYNGVVVDNNAMQYVVRSLNLEKLIENQTFAFNLLDVSGGKLRPVTLYTNIVEESREIILLDSQFRTIKEELFEKDVENKTAKIVATIDGTNSGGLFMYFDMTKCNEDALILSESLNSIKEKGVPGIFSKNRLLLYKQNHMILKLTSVSQ